MVYFYPYIFLFGAMIGSFLNVLILRLPQDTDVVFLRSHCPYCKGKISWFDNIPIFSFLMLKGKCRECKAKISLQYPIVELITGVVFLLLLPRTIDIDSMVLYFFHVGIMSSFIVLFIIDLRHHLLPDQINIYLALTFAALTLLYGNVVEGIIGGLIGIGFPLAVTYLFYKMRGIIGLGGGDIKLYGALGLYLGIQGILFNIFLSCCLGAVVGSALLLTKRIKRETPVPFGPFIIIMATIQIFFPKWMIGLQKFMF